MINEIKVYKYSLKWRLKWIPRHFYFGIFRYRYPLCCVLRFCYDHLTDPYPLSAVKRGTRYEYVPCHIFHSQHAPYKDAHKIVKIDSYIH